MKGQARIRFPPRRLEPLLPTISPREEAGGLLRLVRKKVMTVQNVRELIAISPEESACLERLLGRFAAIKFTDFREQVSKHFEALVTKNGDGHEPGNRNAA
jgi:hypothetical protein